MKKTRRVPFSIPLLFWSILTIVISHAGQAAPPVEPASAGGESPKTAPASVSAVEYSQKGADTCIKCHDVDSEYPVFDIFKTKHAMKADSRTPFAGLQCEACHGPGVKGMAFMEDAQKAGGHVGKVRPGEKRPPILNFGAKSDEPVETQNRMCLQCHEDDNHIAWRGSAHEMGEVTRSIRRMIPCSTE
jgi:nitrate reductase cytochrome c-type subunit